MVRDEEDLRSRLYALYNDLCACVLLSSVCLLSFAVLVVLNHYMAFQYFAEEYYPFSEVGSFFILLTETTQMLHK